MKKGNILALLGKNGSGKTTLIKVMSSLLNPCRGKVTYMGENIELSSNYKSKIGAVLEGNRNIYWYMTAKENFLYFGRLMQLEDKVILKKMDELLDYFDLTEVKDKKVGSFSRGMQQKIAISIALLNDPEILFLDEPTLGLDLKSKKNLIKKIKLLKNDGKIIVLTTHQLDVANELGDELLLLDEGEIIVNENIEKIKKDYAKNRTKVTLIEKVTFEGVYSDTFILDGDIENVLKMKKFDIASIDKIENYKPTIEEILEHIYIGRENNEITKS